MLSDWVLRNGKAFRDGEMPSLLTSRTWLSLRATVRLIVNRSHLQLYVCILSRRLQWIVEVWTVDCRDERASHALLI